MCRILCHTPCGTEVAMPDRLVELLRTHTEPAVRLAAAGALVWLHRGEALPALRHTRLSQYNAVSRESFQ